MFCPTCKGLMRPSPSGPVCPKCGTKSKTKSEVVHSSTVGTEVKEVAVFEEEAATLPTTDEFPCPECGSRPAYFVYRQTRAADEATTIFLQCVKCKHKWRKY